MRAVEDGEFPPPLSVTSQPKRLRSKQPHHSTISSDHLFAGLPQGLSPLIIHNITVFISLLSFILQMWPNNFSLLCFSRSTGPPPCRLCRVWSLLLTLAFLPSKTLSRFFGNITSQKLCISCFHGPCFCSIKQTGKHSRNQHTNLSLDTQIAHSMVFSIPIL